MVVANDENKEKQRINEKLIKMEEQKRTKRIVVKKNLSV